jgi:hypothetical protein
MYGGGVAVGDVQSCEETLAQLCAAVDPASIPLSDAVAVYEAAARMEKLAAGLRLRMAARAEASKAWRFAGYRSAAEWLARVAGTSTGVAHAELAASEHLSINCPAPPMRSVTGRCPPPRPRSSRTPRRWIPRRRTGSS